MTKVQINGVFIDLSRDDLEKAVAEVSSSGRRFRLQNPSNAAFTFNQLIAAILDVEGLESKDKSELLKAVIQLSEEGYNGGYDATWPIIDKIELVLRRAWGSIRQAWLVHQARNFIANTIPDKFQSETEQQLEIPVKFQYFHGLYRDSHMIHRLCQLRRLFPHKLFSQSRVTIPDSDLPTRIKAVCQSVCEYEEKKGKDRVILLPLNHNQVHWTLVAIYPDKKIIEHYDSLVSYAHASKQFLEDAAASIGYKIEYPIKEPVQFNGVDCAIWCTYFAEKIVNPNLQRTFGEYERDLPRILTETEQQLSNQK